MNAHAFPFAGLVGRVGSVRTTDMWLLTLSVLYLQGYDARQKYFKI